MSLKSFIFSQADKPVVKEKKEIDHTYKKFRIEIITSVFISYAVFYLTRKNFSAAMPAMLSDTALTAEDFAIMSSLFYILYGSMKFVGGMLVDKINPKAMTGPVLIGVGIVNILFGFSDSVAAFYVLYSLNAILQGTSFPPMAKIMASWFSKNERGRWWAVVEAAHNIGGSLAPLLTSFAIVWSGSWKMGFYVPGAISLLMGIIALCTIKDRPGTLGLPNVGEWRKDPTELAQVKASPVNLSFWQIFVKYILINPLVWIIIVGDMSVYIARTILNDWPQIYYSQMHGWSLIKANSIISWFEAGGLAGGLLAGYLSDFMFKSNRWMTGLIFALMLCVYYLNPTGSGYLIYHYGHSLHHYGFRPVRPAYAFCRRLSGCHSQRCGGIDNRFPGIIQLCRRRVSGCTGDLSEEQLGVVWCLFVCRARNPVNHPFTGLAG